MDSKETKIATPKAALAEFFFAGGGEYQPITIKASTLAEATKIWEKERIAVGAEPLSIAE